MASSLGGAPPKLPAIMGYVGLTPAQFTLEMAIAEAIRVLGEPDVGSQVTAPELADAPMMPAGVSLPTLDRGGAS